MPGRRGGRSEIRAFVLGTRAFRNTIKLARSVVVVVVAKRAIIYDATSKKTKKWQVRLLV